MNSLSNKNIVITGAASGIGKELARQCAEEGANIGDSTQPDKTISRFAASVNLLRNLLIRGMLSHMRTPKTAP